MKYLVLLVFVCVCLQSCDNSTHESKTTNTLSSQYSLLEDKVLFLKRYFKPNRTFQDLDFSIVYFDNSSGVPGPSDWDIRLVAMVPTTEIDQWISGLNKLPAIPVTTWLSIVPTRIDYSKINEWFGSEFSTVVGINRGLGLVVYRNVTN